jgi:hypothetical protein
MCGASVYLYVVLSALADVDCKVKWCEKVSADAISGGIPNIASRKPGTPLRNVAITSQLVIDLEQPRDLMAVTLEPKFFYNLCPRGFQPNFVFVATCVLLLDSRAIRSTCT